MKQKRTIKDDINDFLEVWDIKQQIAFLKDIIPLFELYDVDDVDDWVKEKVGEENAINVRLIRTVYLISKICDRHSGKLSYIKCKYNNLWKKMENNERKDR